MQKYHEISRMIVCISNQKNQGAVLVEDLTSLFCIKWSFVQHKADNVGTTVAALHELLHKFQTRSLLKDGVLWESIHNVSFPSALPLLCFTVFRHVALLSIWILAIIDRLDLGSEFTSITLTTENQQER